MQVYLQIDPLSVGKFYLSIYWSICLPTYYLIMVLQRNRTIGHPHHTHTHIQILFYLLWELAHMIIEAGKSQDSLPASSRTRKAGSGIQSESDHLRTRGAIHDVAPSWGSSCRDGVATGLSPRVPRLKTRNSSVLWQELMFDQAQAEKANLFLPHFFSSILFSKNWMVLFYGWGWPSLLNPLTQLLISSRSTLKTIPRNNILPTIWASLVSEIHK
jgi:hypothetical protein